MIYNWYKIVDRIEFENEDLPSREVQLLLEDVGTVTVIVLKGILISLVYDGVMLTPRMNDVNPFEFGGYAAYEDPVSLGIYLGIPVPDES